jgi:hypothetical protein
MQLLSLACAYFYVAPSFPASATRPGRLLGLSMQLFAEYLE